MADIKKNRQKIKYEFYEYRGNNPTGFSQTTLNLENPAEVRFLNTSTIGQFALINKIYFLSSILEFNTGASLNPYELILKPNLDEIDTTIYSLQLSAGARVIVIAKYYVNQ